MSLIEQRVAAARSWHQKLAKAVREKGSRDRSLSGKARIKARRKAKKEAR